MDVKKNLMLWAAVLALALPLLVTGTASAKYIGDGAVQNGTTGEWEIPADAGVCISGIKSDGTIVFATGITSRPDCLANIFTAYTTQGTCKTSDSGGADAEGSHYWASTCIVGSGGARTAISLEGLDRTANMCAQKGGTWKQDCTSTWTNLGPSGDGTDGFCYTAVRVDDVYTIGACPAGSCSKTNPNNSDMITSQGTCESQIEVNAAAGGDNDGTCEAGETCDAAGVWTQPTTFGYSIADAGTCTLSAQCTANSPASCNAYYASRSSCEASIEDNAAAGGDDDGTCEAGETCMPKGTWANNYVCAYAYGIIGNTAAQQITRMNSTTAYLNPNAAVDLSTKNMGQCLFDGFSFSNHTTKGGDATVGASTIATPITGVRAGCLACHNNTSQYNSYAGRWKTDYLKTGHRNMLRKVTAGKNWAGPNTSGVIEIYTEAAANQTLDFVNALASNGTWTRPLMYLFGDWMAAAPDGLDTVVWDSAASSAKYNGGSGYSCAACHTTGWRNEDTTKGVCSQSSKTTEATCTGAGGTWYPSTGAEGYGKGGAEPSASFPSYATGSTIAGITGQWDVDGIVCSRCHAVTYDPTLPVNNNGVNAAPGHTTHETDIFSGAKITNICYGCHQSMAKTSNGIGADVDMDHPEAIPTKNSKTAPAYEPEFNSHVLGGSFLNSPHSKFTGTVVPNSLGKYDIAGGTSASAFKGKVCRSNVAVGGGSVLETTSTGGVIASLADCNRANGKPIGDVTNYGYWQDEDQGSCATCHNVHESLFVADAKEPLRRECETCHEDSADARGYKTAGVPQVDVATTINHPKIAGTPFDTNLFKNACEACHMPKATSGGFPMHLWRINNSASYSTFPTYAEFNGICSIPTFTTSAGCSGGGGTWTAATKKSANTAADGTYANAVWVDVDYACGQCHGGSFGSGATKNGALFIDKPTLAAWAKDMHTIAFGAAVSATPNFVWATDPVTSYNVLFNAGSTICPAGETCTYDWDFADTTTGTGVTTTHLFTMPTSTSTFAVKLTVKTTTDTIGKSITKVVYPTLVNHAPVAGGLMTGTTSTNPAIVTNTTNVVSFTDTSSDVDGNILSVSVNWGDGTVETQPAAGGTFTHNYTRAAKFAIIHTVRDTLGRSNVEKAYVKIVPPTYTISGTIVRAGTSTPVSGVSMSLKQNLRTKAGQVSTSTGAYSFKPQLQGTYTMTLYKRGCTFVNPGVITLNANQTINIDATCTP